VLRLHLLTRKNTCKNLIWSFGSENFPPCLRLLDHVAVEWRIFLPGSPVVLGLNLGTLNLLSWLKFFVIFLWYLEFSQRYKFRWLSSRLWQRVATYVLITASEGPIASTLREEDGGKNLFRSVCKHYWSTWSNNPEDLNLNAVIVP
jgi:hypothetical protein